MITADTAYFENAYIELSVLIMAPIVLIVGIGLLISTLGLGGLAGVAVSKPLVSILMF